MNQLPSDAIILGLQKQYYHGEPANTFEPIAPSELRTLENGVTIRNEVRFSQRWPNSFADIYYLQTSHHHLSARRRMVYGQPHGRRPTGIRRR